MLTLVRAGGTDFNGSAVNHFSNQLERKSEKDSHFPIEKETARKGGDGSM